MNNSTFSKALDILIIEGLFNPVSNRYVCSPEHLMPKGHKGRWEHTNIREQDDRDSEYSLYYECKDCGYKWSEEMPD